MKARPSREELLMNTARMWGTRTTCRRAEDGVGAVIALDSRIVSTGYAGPPSGFPECGTHCDLNKPCTGTVHAEANAIVFAARHGIPVEGCTMYCTMEPCLECAKLIINSGIRSVVYLNDYRTHDGLHLLEMAGIKVDRYAERQPLGILPA